MSRKPVTSPYFKSNNPKPGSSGLKSKTVQNGRETRSIKRARLEEDDENRASNEMSDSSGESTDDFEEVEEIESEVEDDDDLDGYHPQLPDEGITITVENDLPQKRTKNKHDKDKLRRLRENRRIKEMQIYLHKSSFMVLFTRLHYLNRITHTVEHRCIAISLLADFRSDLKISQINLQFLNLFLAWFKKLFKYNRKFDSELTDEQRLRKCLLTRFAGTHTELLLAFVTLLRSFDNRNLQTRICHSLVPIPLKTEGILLSEKQMSLRKSNKKADKSKKAKVSKLDKLKGKVGKKGKNRKVLTSESSEEDVAIISPNKTTSIENTASNSKLIEYWCEVLVEDSGDGKWICVEPMHDIVDKPSEIEKLVKGQSTYVIAIDDSNMVKDVTRRYVAKFLDNSFRRTRIRDGWLKSTLALFRSPVKTKQEVEEDRQLEVALSLKPFPQTLDGFKDHPLYCLKKHLLKYQAIYPPDAPVIAYFRKKEPIYPRDCVSTLHTRETWLKEARMVRIGESPYKIVTARPKRDKYSGDIIRDIPSELFGFWQTEQFQPPIAHGGKVPRNSYGNVELFKPCMLPIGTVHLKLPGLLRIAKKLDIDCALAVVGFDTHRGGSHAVMDGFVVCEEFKDILIAAFDEEQENIRLKEEDRRIKQAYANWRRLTRALLIRERLKSRYGSS